MQNICQFIILVTLFIACTPSQRDVNTKNSINTETSNNQLNTLYQDFFIENLRLEQKFISQKTRIIDSISQYLKNDHKKLLLITTLSDCSSCIDQQINYFLEKFDTDQIRNHILIVTDETNYSNLRDRWGKIMNIVNTINLTTNAIKDVFKYQDTKPYFVLYDPKEGNFSSFFTLNQTLTSLQEVYIDEIVTDLKGQ